MGPLMNTGFQPPTVTGDPSDQWRIGTRMKLSDDIRSTSATVGFQEDTGEFGFSIPAGSLIWGIWVKVEAKEDSRSCFLPGQPTAGIKVQLSWDGGSSYTAFSLTRSVSCGASEVILSYLDSGDDTPWGRTWDASEFTDANFRVRVEHAPSINVGIAAIDQVTCRISFFEPTRVHIKGGHILGGHIL